MLRANGGFSGCPWGVIQSRIGPLRLFVSSDLAPEMPFCILELFKNQCIVDSMVKYVLNQQCAWYPLRSLPTAAHRGRERLRVLSGIFDVPFVPWNKSDYRNQKHQDQKTYSCVNVSLLWSVRSPIRSNPLVSRALTLHRAWTVRPKCLP
jgi:hypothetical protein